MKTGEGESRNTSNIEFEKGGLKGLDVRYLGGHVIRGFPMVTYFFTSTSYVLAQGTV